LLICAQDAFDEHYPLKLSPAVIWLTIAQSFAGHVNENAKDLRAKFVTHEGREELSIVVDAFTEEAPDNDWSGVFQQFSKEIGKRVQPGISDIFDVSDVSSATAVDAHCAAIVMMDTAKEYFQYVSMTRCGIPWIELLGTLADWRKVRAKVERLDGFDEKVSSWVSELRPVLDEFVNACEGRVDPVFWGAITNIAGPSGSGGRGPVAPTGRFLSGWMRAFFIKSAYGLSSSLMMMRSRGVERLLEEARERSRRMGWLNEAEWPSCISKVPVKMIWTQEGKEEMMTYLAALVAVQHPDGALEPRSAWAIVRA
jgi:hypothetical protein